MKKILLAVIVIFVLVFAVHAATVVMSDTVKIKLREHTFFIPKKNAMERESVMPEWLINMSGLDDGSSTTLIRFDGLEIKETIASYKVADGNQFADDIKVLMAALTQVEIDRYKDPNFYAQLGDMWRAEGSYKNRKIEPAGIPGWYKVYRKVEYPKSWMLVSELPESGKPLPENVSDFWVADCVRLGPKGKEIADCTTYELINDIVLEFGVSEYNLPLLNDVREFIKGKVMSWKQS